MDTLRKKIVFQDQLSLNAGQKYCRMLQGEHARIPPNKIRLNPTYIYRGDVILKNS